MTQLTLDRFLQKENLTLGTLLNKFNQLVLWNTHLQACLPEQATLLEHCKIVSLDKQSLIVMASNPHWVTRFRCFIPELLPKLRRYPEFQTIRAICCKVKPANYGSSKKAKRPPLKITTQTAQILNTTADKIQDKKLKEVLKRMASYSERL